MAKTDKKAGAAAKAAVAPSKAPAPAGALAPPLLEDGRCSHCGGYGYAAGRWICACPAGDKVRKEAKA